MTLTFPDLVADAAKDQPRPYRLAGESNADLLNALGADAPSGPFTADISPDLKHFAQELEAFTESRLTNTDRGELEDLYNKGLLADAWNGFFYDAALSVSQRLAHDERLAKLEPYRNNLRYFSRVRAYRKGGYVFLQGRVFEDSSNYGSLTLPIDALCDAADNPNLVDVEKAFGDGTIDELRNWLQITPGVSEPDQRFTNGSEFDVFLSHRSIELEPASKIADYLSSSGKRVFFSPTSLPSLGSTEYMKAIDEALEGSRHFILYAGSLATVSSSWVEAEWRMFINEKRSDRKNGNFLTIASNNFDYSELPMSLRYYEIILEEGDYLKRALDYVV